MKFLKLLFIFSLFSVIFASHVEAKSYFISQVNTHIAIQKDGSFIVNEERSFDFTGSYTRVFWDIITSKGEQISNITIKEKNKIQEIPYTQLQRPDSSKPPRYYFVASSIDSTHIEAYHSSTNEIKTFVLSYTVSNGIKSYDDVSDFYWKIVGENWDTYTQQVKATITLPETTDINNLHIWGHGTLNGNVQIIDGQTALFTVSNIPPQTFAEIRFVFPSFLLTNEKLDSVQLPTIQSEENHFRNATIANQQVKRIGIIVIIICLITYIFFWYTIWKKVGKELIPVHQNEGIPFPPNTTISPALVDAMVNQEESVSTNSFTATILHLARLGYLRIESQQYYTNGILGLGSERKYRYTLHFTEKETSTLPEIDNQILEFLKEHSINQKDLNIEDLQDAMKSNKNATKLFYSQWIELVKKTADKLNFVEDGSKKWRAGFTFCSVLFFLFISWMIMWVLNIHNQFNLAVIIWGIFISASIFFSIGRIFLRWSSSASKEVNQWIDFKKYISNVSRIKNELPQALPIWQEILIYGTALGIAKKVSEYMPLILSQVSNYPTWYGYSSVNGNSNQLSGFQTDFCSSLSESLSNITSSLNSSISTGSGGGFSGGGGGGGAS